MNEEIREIWFRCPDCKKDCYCESEIEASPIPEVMCPFCRKTLLLPDVRLDRPVRL